jgi:hypothetical protein
MTDSSRVSDGARTDDGRDDATASPGQVLRSGDEEILTAPCIYLVRRPDARAFSVSPSHVGTVSPVERNGVTHPDR